jgi:hypothetical protein
LVALIAILMGSGVLKLWTKSENFWQMS